MENIKPDELPDFGYAFLEPRCLFDDAITSLEVSEFSSKIYYRASSVEKICLERYGSKVWTKLLSKLQELKDVIELV